MAILIPDPDQFTDTLKVLLDLSDRPRDVKIVSIQAIEVPDHVAERYQSFQTSEAEDGVEEVPKKRGPGRPRKNPLPEEQA